MTEETWEKEFLEELLKLCAKHRVRWIADDNTQWSLVNNIDFTDDLVKVISNLLSLHDKKLAEKVRGIDINMEKQLIINDSEYAFEEGFEKAKDLAAQVIEGREGE